MKKNGLALTSSHDALTTPLAPRSDGEQAHFDQGAALNTLRSYDGALRYWATWHACRYGSPLPARIHEEVAIQFILDHAPRATADGRLITDWDPAWSPAWIKAGLRSVPGTGKPATWRHRFSVMARYHDSQTPAGDINPCRTPRIQDLLGVTRRSAARRGEWSEPKDALARDELEQMLSTCDDTLRGLRDRALLLFAFSSGGRRRSEVTSAEVEHLRRVEEGFLFRLHHSKTDQAGTQRGDQWKPVLGRAGDALKAWLEASGIRSGPLFRRIRKGDVVGEPLAAAAVRDIVIARCRLAGLEGDFSAHSLRSGFVTEASRQDVPLPEVMALTGHRAVNSVVRYHRPDNPRSRGARLLEPSAPSAVAPTPEASASTGTGAQGDDEA